MTWYATAVRERVWATQVIIICVHTHARARTRAADEFHYLVLIRSAHVRVICNIRKNARFGTPSIVDSNIVRYHSISSSSSNSCQNISWIKS